jgi:hypothetical protein
VEDALDNAQPSGLVRSDYLAEILSLCSTLSAEAVEAVENKAKANQFNLNRGEISFAEISINLQSARDVLADAIGNRKLIQLPITVQKDLLANLQAVTKAIQGIMNNSDEILNLDSAVEALNTSIWKYGLHNLSDQVLGYQAKLNQLKQEEVRAKRLLEVLETGTQTAERLDTLSKQADAATDQIARLRLSAEESSSALAVSRQQFTEELAKASASAAGAAQSETQAAQSGAAVKTAAAEIAPLEASIKGFFSEIDNHRRQMATFTDEASKFITESNGRITAEIERWNSTAKSASDTQAQSLANGLELVRKSYEELAAGIKTSEAERLKQASDASAIQLKRQAEEHISILSASEKRLSELESALKQRSEETVEKNQSETHKLIDELAILKESIKEQLIQATGYGQFGAFQARQNTVARTKYVWVGAIGLLAIAVVVLTAYIAFHAQQNDLHSAAFWIKLSMNVPLGFLITFCTIQYNRERRLEEEYAFKASISVSLTPYRDMIYSIIEKEGLPKDGTFTKFVIEAVRSVFSSPTERVFDSSKGIENIPEKALKSAAELIGTVVKATK